MQSTFNEQYLTWLDAIVSDEVAFYNKALGVTLLLDTLKA